MGPIIEETPGCDLQKKIKSDFDNAFMAIQRAKQTEMTVNILDAMTDLQRLQGDVIVNHMILPPYKIEAHLLKLCDNMESLAASNKEMTDANKQEHVVLYEQWKSMNEKISSIYAKQSKREEPKAESGNILDISKGHIKAAGYPAILFTVVIIIVSLQYYQSKKIETTLREDTIFETVKQTRALMEMREREEKKETTTKKGG